MFEGKTWWITGASSGIGSALALALSDARASLVLSGRNEAALRAVAAACRSPVLQLPFEATDFGRIPGLVEEAWSWSEQQTGGVHGLVNNAGISQRSLAADTAFEVYEKIIGVDLLAPIALTQSLLPRMIAAGEGQIVAISSVAGIIGAPLRSAYSAAKHGLIGYHDSVRAETEHLGLRVLVVAPGSVRTNVSRNALNASAQARGISDEAIEHGMEPAAAAGSILDALRAGRRELILAEGTEAEMVRLRRSDPDALFDILSKLVSGGYASRMNTPEN
ncbi:MAG: SDR family NAD(P)-dependent oxidoreductase [Hyphomonas sp.]|nr:SDR family NAD(P)-dependent oxidoreductase [Hyphomonas sp.]